MQDTIFREYDIRGKIDGEFVIDEVYNLTRAIVYYFMHHNPAVKTIVVGMDGRTHSSLIKKHMCRAIIDSGLDVMFIGVCPSPAVYFALHTMPVQAGLMITASHNPKEYNGIKVCLGKKSIWGNQLKEIRDLYHAGKYIKSDHVGAIRDEPVIDIYVSWLVDHFSSLKNMKLSAVIDCVNGTAGTVLALFNHEADPVVERNMQEVKKMLQKTDVSVGLGLDGDCDRMAPMTKKGILVPGDQLLALFVQQVLRDYPGCTIVFDIKSSSGLIELIEKWGGIAHMSPSGHAIVKDQMQKHKALLGGELSCHFFFHDRYFGYDDGIYAALRLFELLHQSGKSLDELIAVFPQKYNTREFRIACPDNKKAAIITHVKNIFSQRTDAQLITIDGVRVTLPYGWAIVRPSNTQSVLSVRLESDTRDGLKRIKKDFIIVLQPYFDLDLQKLFE